MKTWTEYWTWYRNIVEQEYVHQREMKAIMDNLVDWEATDD